MKKIFIVVVFVVLIFPTYSLGDTIGGGGGGGSTQPPAKCNTFQVNNYQPQMQFEQYEKIDYVNGLLTINFKIKDDQYNDGLHPLKYLDVDLYGNNCQLVVSFQNLEMMGTYDTNVYIPAHTTDVSLRFTSPTHFQMWDDTHNIMLVCPICDYDFSNQGYGANLQAVFNLGTYGTTDDDIFNFQSEVYSDSALIQGQNEPAGKTPVLIIPGVLGTEMYKGTDLLWANLGKMFTDVGDTFMDPLQFNANLTPFDGSVVKGDVVANPDKLFDYSDGLIQEFQNQGYTQGTSATDNLFLFPYDWRYGISGKYADGSTNADLLKQKIDEIRAQTGSDKVDVIAHSTGGLLVKQYVMDHPTDNHIDKAVFVGVPNLGAPLAIKVLLEGDSFGVPWLADSEMQKVTHNLPVVYDLSPSQQYYDSLGSYMRVGTLNFFTPSYKDLTYSQTEDYLKNNNFNSQAIDNASNLHTSSFDNYDMRTAGVDLYNIVGCKSGTVGSLMDMQDVNGVHQYYDLNPDHEFSGDGTVPFGSADSLVVNADHTFFALKADHGKMPSEDGIRQEVVNLLTGSNLGTNGKILSHDSVQSNPKLCQIKGESINIKSPVAVGATDQDGNFSGIAPDGSIQNDIPGADYEVWGEHKYVFLPTDDNQTYTIKLAGTGNGTFTLDDQSIDGDSTTQTQVFSNLPVTTSLVGTVSLGATDTLNLDTNGDGITDKTVQPSSVVNAEQSMDMTPPISTSTMTGTIGQPGFYRSNISINLSATDPIINGDASGASGILKTVYSLDNAATTTYQSPIAVTGEGQHTLSFFSTDRAGNNEQPQSVTFTIDKTAPEATIQFSPLLKDIQFTGNDNISTSSKITVADNINDILLTDQAGNNTDIKLKEKNRKISMASTLQSLSYNGVAQDISKNILAFVWAYDKNNNLTGLSQNVAAKKTYDILAVYGGKNTTLLGIDKTGIILKSIPGLDLLKVSTNKGDLGWSY